MFSAALGAVSMTLGDNVFGCPWSGVKIGVTHNGDGDYWSLFAFIFVPESKVQYSTNTGPRILSLLVIVPLALHASPTRVDCE